MNTNSNRRTSKHNQQYKVMLQTINGTLMVIHFILIVQLILPQVWAQTFPQQNNTYRIMSYNIHHDKAMGKKIDIERLGKLIIDIEPDAIGLQNVDSAMIRSDNIDMMQLLSEQTNMHATFGYSVMQDAGKHGNGVLTKEKPITTRKIALPSQQEAKTALIIELEKYVLVNTILSLNKEERVESVKIITDSIKEYNKPVFLMGNLNAMPDSSPIEFLKEKLQILSNPNKPTYPSTVPQETLDYILGYKGKGETYAKYASQVIDEQIISNHRPLFVDIRLKTPASEVMRTIPYLQSPGKDEMTVMWLTNVPARSLG